MIHAQINSEGVCIGCSNLSKMESNQNLVYLPDGWNEDFLWRKWDNGEWSSEKFLPPDPVPTPSPEQLEINDLKERLATAEQTAAEVSDTQQQLLELLIDLGVL